MTVFLGAVSFNTQSSNSLAAASKAAWSFVWSFSLLAPAASPAAFKVANFLRAKSDCESPGSTITTTSVAGFFFVPPFGTFLRGKTAAAKDGTAKAALLRVVCDEAILKEKNQNK